MEYLTAQEIADRWNLSKRTVQQLCAAHPRRPEIHPILGHSRRCGETR